MRFVFQCMKQIFLILVVCITVICTQAQEVEDTINVRVQYHAKYKHTQEQKEAFDDVNLLDIGKQTSRFYSQRFEQFLLLRDSVERTTQDPMNKLQFSASMYGSKKGREYEVYKHIPQKGHLLIPMPCTTTFSFAMRKPFLPLRGNWPKAIPLSSAIPAIRPSVIFADAPGRPGTRSTCLLIMVPGSWAVCPD